MGRGTQAQQKFYYHSPPFIKNIITSIYGLKQRKERHGRYYHKHLQLLFKSQWFSRTELEDFQFNRVKTFLIAARDHSLYYNKLFDSVGFNPDKFGSKDELSKLPLLSKQTIRENKASILPSNLNQYKAKWSHTSGTTGQALVFPISLECFQREYAFRTLHYSWGDIGTNDKVAVCAGHPVTYYDSKKPPFWTYDYFNNWLIMSSSHLSARNLPNYIHEIAKFEPALLKGYPSSIYLLALANNKVGKIVNPKAVYVASETLFDFQRKVIEESFGCKVYMWYGTGEMTGNIVECPMGKYHLKLEHSYIEILDENDNPIQPGQEGRIVSTAFGNFAMPFIRYDIGDVAELSEDQSCECGRGGEIISKVVGRVEDYILTPDGRFVGRLDHLFKDSEHVINGQLLQNTVGEIIIRIVKTQEYSIGDEDKILKEARLRLGSEIDIRFEYVEDIPRSPNGKFRFVVSNIEKKRLYDNTISI